jgi:hypothetical protein
MILSLTFEADSITSADATAISTFIVTTLSGGYTMKFLEINNSGHILLKLA